MAKVAANASLGVKLKIFSDYENINPHASISVEKDLPTNRDYSDDELVDEAGQLYEKCRKFVENKIEADIKLAKEGRKK